MGGVTPRRCRMEILADLVTEDVRLESILDGLDSDAWRSPSGAPGWTIADVVLHLAQTEEAVVRSIDAPPAEETWWREGPETVDELVDARVREERSPPEEIFARWRAGVDGQRRPTVTQHMRSDPWMPPVQGATARSRMRCTAR